MAESVSLRREARAMAGFAHPHLALIFGIESWRGSPALVMEYLEGGTLADRLRRSRLMPAEAARVAYDLAGAIALIHDAGLLHRDIKPSNIAFTTTGEPKLLDFGLAQMFAAGAPTGSVNVLLFARRLRRWPLSVPLQAQQSLVPSFGVDKMGVALVWERPTSNEGSPS